MYICIYIYVKKKCIYTYAYIVHLYYIDNIQSRKVPNTVERRSSSEDACGGSWRLGDLLCRAVNKG